MASTGSPSAVPAEDSGCTTSSFQPVSVGCFTVATA